MPGTDRNIRKSLMARLRGMLQSPAVGSGLSAYKVYNEDDLRAIDSGAPLPARPFVFLLDSYMRPKVPVLPMVIVEVPKITQAPYEVGNRKGRMSDAIIHCFGRKRGERDDLGSYITDFFGMTFPVYQYTSGASGDTSIFLENAELTDEILIEERAGSLSQDERREGSLDLWTMVRISFRTRT